MRNFEELCDKYSGTCFIVGSGPSLNSQNLGFLANYTTIAVNAGYIAVPEADFFVSDDQDVVEWQYAYDALRQSDKTQVLLYEWKFQRFGNWQECRCWYGNRLVSFSHRKGYHLTHQYQHDHPKYGIWQARSSLGSAIHLAYLMNFKEIVLLGVDCVYVDGKRHFYEVGKHRAKPERRRPFFQRRFPRKIGKHTTDQDLLDILSYWNRIYERIGNHFTLRNASPISIIKNIPKVNIEHYNSCIEEKHS